MSRSSFPSEKASCKGDQLYRSECIRKNKIDNKHVEGRILLQKNRKKEKIYFLFVENVFCIIDYPLDNRSVPSEIVRGETNF